MLEFVYGVGLIVIDA